MSDCQNCPRETREEHALCHICEKRAATHLEEFPSLYRALENCIPFKAPSVGKNVAVEAPAPCNIDALNLTAPGGIADILGSWVEDWYQLLDFSQPTYDYRADHVATAVHRLRVNLPWAAEHHPAAGDFAHEIAQLNRRAHRVIDGDTPRIPLGTCECGGPLTANPATLAAHCPGCRTEWRGPQLIELAETCRNANLPAPVA